MCSILFCRGSWEYTRAKELLDAEVVLALLSAAPCSYCIAPLFKPSHQARAERALTSTMYLDCWILMLLKTAVWCCFVSQARRLISIYLLLNEFYYNESLASPSEPSDKVPRSHVSTLSMHIVGKRAAKRRQN